MHDGVVQQNGTPNATDIAETTGDYGLRSAFNEQDEEIEIATNYLPINLQNGIDKIYVYEIEIISHYSKDGNAVKLRNRFYREVIFNELLNNGPTAFQGLRADAAYWVTDYGLIWSVRPLLRDSNGNSLTPLTASQVRARDRSFIDFNCSRGHC
jgi:hypothetical protein